jgi:Cof subfamily protein (haloacid dehalogenase superfamily)
MTQSPSRSAQTTAQTTAQEASGSDPSQIRLLVLDIDGTIAGSANSIRQPVKQAVQAAQAKGIQVAIATGRMYRAALRFHEDIGANLPLMAYQGAFVKDPASQTLHRHWTLSQSHATALLDYFEQPDLRHQLSVHFYIDDQLYVREITPMTAYYTERSGVTPIVVGDLRTVLTAEPTSQPTKVLAMSEDTDLIQALQCTLKQTYNPTELYVTTSVPIFLEATNPAVNKGTAVRYLAEELLGLQPENVMAIGDNFNDLEMLEYAGIGIAMGEAPAGVQAVATWVAPGVEEDGAAVAIAKFLL